MNKRVFMLIIFLMSISLIGIVVVQFNWINKSIEMSETQFTSVVSSALMKVSENISERELNEFYTRNFSRLIQSKAVASKSEMKAFLYEQIDTVRNERFQFKQSILEENYKVLTDFFEEQDTVFLKKIYSKEKIVIVKNQFSGDSDWNVLNAEETFFNYGQLKEYEKLNLKEQSQILNSRLPIYRRVTNRELSTNIEQELLNRGIETAFKYGVYDNDFATKLKSGYFRLDANKTYEIPLFINNKGESKYQLYVSFPDKKSYFLSTVGKNLMLSALFILIIIMAFISSLYQMIKQKQISEIKTDFINNMTHEFKTPIATINLALDAIKNPKVIHNKDTVLRYVSMIREENKRMHAQVENVLRISQLEKNQLDMNKDAQDVHDLIDDAISHVNLLVKSKNGIINTHLNASFSEVLANGFHFTSLIVNVLENAIKYSPDAPIIDVTTECTAKTLILKVEDQGMGMTKNVQKNIFKKFYREETGNIHNVKGHGLGLAYVKKIIEHHQGTIHVESEKEKGSVFIIKLPLI